MRVLFFVHTFEEKNGIALHVQNIVKFMPKEIECAAISGGAFSIPFFSALKFPIKENWDALTTDFDVMHIHGYGNFFSFFGALIATIKRKPLVWTIHGYPRIGGARKLFYFVYRYFMAPIILWKADRIIAVSEEAKRILASETNKEIVVMPNGVNLDLFKPRQTYLKQKHACYVGRLDEDKGVMRMLDITSLPVLFIGPDEGNTKNKLKQEAERVGRTVTFEEVEPDKMPDAYEKCKYIILPSKYEGFPMTLLESVAMERPFVSTDVGEVKKTLSTLYDKPEKFIIKENLDEKIDELDLEDLEAELKKARKKAEAYSWKSITALLAKMYSECF